MLIRQTAHGRHNGSGEIYDVQEHSGKVHTRCRNIINLDSCNAVKDWRSQLEAYQ